LTPSKSTSWQAATFESFIAAARTQVVTTELFLQQFVTMHDANAAFHVRLRREAPASLAHRLKRTARWFSSSA
jgi:hypothetical protein